MDQCNCLNPAHLQIHRTLVLLGTFSRTTAAIFQESGAGEDTARNLTQLLLVTSYSITKPLASHFILISITRKEQHTEIEIQRKKLLSEKLSLILQMSVMCMYCSLPVCLQKLQFQYVSAVWKLNINVLTQSNTPSVGRGCPTELCPGHRHACCIMPCFNCLTAQYEAHKVSSVLYTQKVLNNRHKAFCAHTPPNQTCLQARDPHKSREVVKALLWVCLLAHQGYHVQILCTHLTVPSKQCSHI